MAKTKQTKISPTKKKKVSTPPKPIHKVPTAHTPVMTNKSIDLTETCPQKPPHDLVPPTDPTTYADALKTSIDTPFTDHALRSTFLIQKEIYDTSPADINDDDTIVEDNTTTQDVSTYQSVRMTMMFKIPGKKEGCDDDDAPLIAIQKMNEMVKALTNKLPCFVGPWKNSNLQYGDIKKADLLTVLPENIDFVESYVFD